MSRKDFIEEVATIIEMAIMRTQGIGDYLGHEASPLELAAEIADLAEQLELRKS